MTKHSPIPGKGLLERAADLYDFGAALRGKGLPPVTIPADAMPPVTPEPAVVQDTTVSFAKPRARDWTRPVQPLDRGKMAEAGYLVPGGPVSGVSEEFRIIKRALLATIRGTKHQDALPNGNLILVASAHPGDGKTFCAINLAVSLAAESDLEVLLVDADFGKPSIPAALGLSGETGMMDALVDPRVAIEDCVLRTDVPSFSVLPAGTATHNDSEHLASTRTDAILDALVAGRPERVVIFDSPPLLSASPASVLASHVGQTLLVVRADRTTETTLRDAADLLRGCGHIELLLNGVKFSASGRRFGSYYGKGG
ncbi:AAA family ATPase [Sphingobium subterraneum]|uniref:Exopolysaccharide/PEP-CTERM locus tyrosine autokinase n=1 Tax=Sphingobium subterraneum TaxID=627688 RepID=A0A841IVQ7_9SPHN|nr:P-loop NTPase [Sphingobium subterraneum]MBB6122753.1 exopolysaccharide/PEP-CTERM locus tyrosine autokinase [Sphingobium subterraneum]